MFGITVNNNIVETRQCVTCRNSSTEERGSKVLCTTVAEFYHETVNDCRHALGAYDEISISSWTGLNQLCFYPVMSITF